MNSRLLFNSSATIEVLAGIAMLFAPAFVIGLLLGDGLGSLGVVVTRILGIGLVALGISTWEAKTLPVHNAGRIGLCTYNFGVAALLSMAGIIGGMGGPLLWPVVGLHGLIGTAMIFAFSR